jgi:hypothetical protein
MANTCAEGHRKKAKYLLDEDELGECPLSTVRTLSGPDQDPAALKKSKDKDKDPAAGKPPLPHSLSSAAPKPPPTLRPHEPPTNVAYNTTSQHSQGFGSQVANMEYSMLSAILGDQAHDDPALPNPPPRVNGHPLDLHSHRLVVSTDFGPLASEQPWPSRPADLPPPQTPTPALPPPQQHHHQQNSHPEPMYGQSGHVDVPMFGPDARGAPMPGASMYSSLPQPDTSPLSSQPPPTASSYLPLQPISSHSSGQVAASTDLSNDSLGPGATTPSSHASNVFGTVTAPYDYTKVFYSRSHPSPVALCGAPYIREP